MPEEEKTTEEAQTTTQEPDQAALKAELEQTKKELEQTKKGLSTAHQTLTEKDKELKKLQNFETRQLELEDRIELLATALASGVKPDDAGLEEVRPDVVNVLKQKRQEQEAKRKQDELLQAQQEFTRRADDIYSKAETIYGEDEDALYNIRSLIRAGDLDLAERKVNKVAKAKETTTKETEEQRIDRLANEKLQKKLEERGLLSSETNLPSGGNLTKQQAMERYIKGEINADEAKKAGVKFD